MKLNLDQARRQAKELLSAARAGDADARARMRSDRALRLADAQRAVASELGFRSWPALVAHGDGRADSLHDTGAEYVPGQPIRIRVRRRTHRYDIDDMGEAVAIAGHPPGWLTVARRVVAAAGWNINRAGIVSVPAVEGCDIDRLVRRTAEVSAAVLEALLVVEDQG